MQTVPPYRGRIGRRRSKARGALDGCGDSQFARRASRFVLDRDLRDPTKSLRPNRFSNRFREQSRAERRQRVVGRHRRDRKLSDRRRTHECLRGLAAGAKRSAHVELSDGARELLKQLAADAGVDDASRTLARELIRTLHVESSAERTERIAASTRLSDLQLTAADRSAALADVAEEDDRR